MMKAVFVKPFAIVAGLIAEPIWAEHKLYFMFARYALRAGLAV